MAGAVNIVNPETGEVGSVPAEDVARTTASGDAHVATPGELAKIEKDRKVDPIGTYAAGEVGVARGFGEAFGVPVDPLVVGIADAFGQKEQARSSLARQRQEHGVASALGEMGGVAGGLVAGGEVLGASEALQLPRAGTALGRIAQGTASGAVRGGVENMIAGSTRDINEAALGDPGAVGQKFYASMPKHFLVGAVGGGLFGGAGSALGEIGSSAPAFLDRQASGMIGRDLGESGEAAVSLGNRVRGSTYRETGRTVPRDASEIADIFGREQATLRKGAGEAYEGALAGAETSTREAGLLAREMRAAEHESSLAEMAMGHGRARGARASELGEGIEGLELAGAREREAAGRETWGAFVQAKHAERELGMLEAQHGQAREALYAQRAHAVEEAEKVASERTANAAELESTVAKMAKGEPPPLRTDGKLTHAEFKEIIDTQLGAMGRQRDPSTRWALEQQLIKEHGDPIESLAEHGAKLSSVGTEAQALHVERLKNLGLDLTKAEAEARKVVQQFDKATAQFEKQSGAEIAQARARAEQAAVLAQRTAAKAETVSGKTTGAVESAQDKAAKELAALEQKQAAELARARKSGDVDIAKMERRHEAEVRAAQKAVPKPGQETSADSVIAKANESAERGKNRPLVSPQAALGGVLSLAHGNLPAAALSIGGSLVASQLRTSGNYTAARVLRGVADQIAKVDRAIAKGAAKTAGRAMDALGPAAAGQAEDASRSRAPSFDKVSARVRAAQANPRIVETHIRAQIGHLAVEAPGIYASVLEAAQREQQFLSSKLPPDQTDPHSLTPHLETSNISEAAKYDFMQTVDVLDDAPGMVFKKVIDGSLTEAQMEAVEYVMPEVADQMRAETQRVLAKAKEPLPYEREIHLGTLLGIVTDEVLERDFQSALQTSYETKAESGKPLGSKKPGESKIANSMQSTGQSIEGAA